MSTLTREQVVEFIDFLLASLNESEMEAAARDLRAHDASQREQLRLANSDQLQTEADLAAMTRALRGHGIEIKPDLGVEAGIHILAAQRDAAQRRIVQLEEELFKYRTVYGGE